jgi:Tol biopolymer transport system component
MRAHRTITILAVLVAAASVANGGETTVVSTDSSGNLGNFGIDPNFAVDETGTLVFFASFSNDLVSGDTNGKSDVFLKDLSSGTTTRIVMGLNGAEPNGRCEWVDVSSDGLFVAFTSDADNLVQGDKNSLEDVFVLDRRADTIERVSVSSTGAEANNVPVEGPSISDDGRYVLFTTFADNLVAGDSAFTRDVFLRDRKSGTTVCVSVDPNGNPGTANSLLGGITGKGTTAFFSSDSSMLVSRDDNGVRDCFMRDLTAGVTERVSLAPDGSSTGIAIPFRSRTISTGSPSPATRPI